MNHFSEWHSLAFSKLNAKKKISSVIYPNMPSVLRAIEGLPLPVLPGSHLLVSDNKDEAQPDTLLEDYDHSS